MSEFSYFAVELIDDVFKINEQEQTPQTARIRYFDDNNNVVQTIDFGYLEKDLIYHKIKSNQPITLDNCYVKDFSLGEYRTKYEKSNIHHVELVAFSAINTFFDSTGTIDFSYASFMTGSINFTNSRFARGNLNFSKCRFKDCDVNFSNVSFGKGYMNFQFSEFGNGNISFENALFGGGNISFVNADFGNGNVIFKNVNFGIGDIEFHYSKFGKGDKWFDRTIFRGRKVDFRKVEFGDGKVEFRKSDFGNAEVSFDESEFGKAKISFRKIKSGSGGLTFEMTHFGNNEIYFDQSDFGTGGVSFLKAVGGMISLKACQLNSYVDLRVHSADYIDLSDSIVRDLIDLDPGITKVEVREINFSGMRNLGRILIDWNLNGVYQLIRGQKNTTLWSKAEQFRILKEEFRNAGRYNDEDKAYVEFKRLELKAWKNYKIKKNKRNAIWVYPAVWSEMLLFDRMGLYATSPLRVLSSILIVYTFFSLAYVTLEGFFGAGLVSGVGDPDNLSPMAKAFYQSAITFLTIGYGDIYPTGFFRIVCSLEGFVGVFMMSYFVVAFVRKILR